MLSEDVSRQMERERQLQFKFSDLQMELKRYIPSNDH